MNIVIKDLKPGDRFDWIGGSWHGPSIVTENTPSGADIEPSRWNPLGGIRRLAYANTRIINPPGPRI